MSDLVRLRHHVVTFRRKRAYEFPKIAESASSSQRVFYSKRDYCWLLARSIPLEYDTFHMLTKIIFILDLGSDGNLAIESDWRRALALKIHA